MRLSNAVTSQGNGILTYRNRKKLKMFKHRFNPENAHDFRNVIDAVDLMTGRAKSTLTMFVSYVEGEIVKTCISSTFLVLFTAC
jgi:hypothetical protein